MTTLKARLAQLEKRTPKTQPNFPIDWTIPPGEDPGDYATLAQMREIQEKLKRLVTK